MIGYASSTGSRRNLDALSAAGWRLLFTPETYRPGVSRRFRFAVNNGAWGAFQKKQAFDDSAFKTLIERCGAQADFVIIPDIVAGGVQSFEFSLSWMSYLKPLRLLLLPVQDGMTAELVAPFLRAHPNTGIFLGGSTEWKLREMYAWGMVAHSLNRYYHVGRVNSARRIQLAAEAGADSFDGSSATRFSKTLPLLESSLRQPRLFTARS